MALLDAFTGNAAKDAANATRDYLDKSRLYSLGDINAGLANATNYVQGGASAARNALGGGYGTSVGATNTGADAALANLDAGTRDALARYGAAGAPLTALGSKYGAATTLGLGALGVNGPEGTAAARAAFETSPGYMFQLDQGLEAINRARNARGMLNSGNTDRDAQVYGQGLAKQDYQTWLNNLLGFTNPELSATTGASNIGVRGADVANQAGINRANVESARGSMLADLAQRYGTQSAGLETSTGNTLADLASNAAARKVGVNTSVMQPYANTYGQEAAATQQGSANLFNLGINAAKLAAGIPSLGGGVSGAVAGLGGTSGNLAAPYYANRYASADQLFPNYGTA